MSAIVIQNGHLRYHDRSIFENLALEIPLKQWTCILGQSGVGKSSLLRLLANLPAQDSTRYSADIEAPFGKSLEGRIAYLAQKDLLMPWASVLENVLIGYRLRGQSITQKKTQAIELLRAVGLGDYVFRRPAALSGGMRQRVALVRTLLEDKPIILMDESFSALDVVTRYRLQDLALKLLKGRTVILITHDPAEAIRLGDCIHILAGNPAAVVKTLKLEESTPRDQQARYSSWYDEIWQALIYSE